MAYSTEHREALGYILTDLHLQMNRAKSLWDVNHIVLTMKGQCSNFTEGDNRFTDEWARIQGDRKGLEQYEQGTEGWEEEDMAFRMREYEALTRAADKNGVLRHNPTPRTAWTPKAEVTA